MLASLKSELPLKYQCPSCQSILYIGYNSLDITIRDFFVSCSRSLYRSSLDNTIQVPYFVLDILDMQFYLFCSVSIYRFTSSGGYEAVSFICLFVFHRFGRIRSSILVCPFVVLVYTVVPLQADTKQYPLYACFVVSIVPVLRYVMPYLGLVPPRLTMQY